MSHAAEQAYYTRRMEEERARVAQAPLGVAAHIHRVLANAYARRVDQLTGSAR